MGKKKRSHRKQLDRARSRRAAFARRQKRRKRMTQVLVGGMIALLSLLMVVTLMPGDLGALFGGDAEPVVDDPADDPLADEDIGGVACDAEVPAAAGEEKPQWEEPPEMQIDPEATYRATLESSCGAIVLELFAADSPRTVNSFVFLAREGFYDGLTFHRVVPGFVIQGGDPEGTGVGGPGYRFEDELDLAEDRGYPMGTLAMANSGPDTNGSQFFIALETADQQLEPLYSVFGEVVDGIGAVGRIGAVPTAGRDQPLQQIYIESVTIEEIPADDPPDGGDEEDADADGGDADEENADG